MQVKIVLMTRKVKSTDIQLYRNWFAGTNHSKNM